MSSDTENLIIKTVLHAGSQNIIFKDGTKVHFHFNTRICNKEKTVLDDSRKMGDGKPMELVIGKKFKLEVWEAIVQRMALHEVAQFKVHKNLVMQYPFVSKTLRDASKPREARSSHCCAMTLQTQGVGYDDLNSYLKNPEDLEFTIDLVKVEHPEEYKKETWQMTDDERLDLVPQLKETGNKCYRSNDFKTATESYAKAIGLLEQLMLKEKPHTEEWDTLNQQKVQILLNYAQSLFKAGDYYGTIEHCSTVLQTEKDNVKALFRRAKAHAEVWNSEEARKDFQKVVELDPSLESTVKKELHILDENGRKKDTIDKEKLKNLFT